MGAGSASQFVFAIGFYALALFLRNDMRLSGSLSGLLLGLRIFAQQCFRSGALRWPEMS